MTGLTGIAPVILVVVIVMAFRVRRTMTEQPYRALTIWIRTLLLGALGLYVLYVEMRSIDTLLGVAGGLVAGLILAGYSLSHTTFNLKENPPRYKTNPYIGAVVVTLFAIRILYDAMSVRAKVAHPGPINPINVSWLAALLYFLFVAYWIAYYIGIIRRLGSHRGGSSTS